MTDLEVVNKLDTFFDLKRDWNSYGAEPIRTKCIAIAAILSTQVRFDLTDIVPLPNGGVQLEWKADGVEIECEINPDHDHPSREVHADD